MHAWPPMHTMSSDIQVTANWIQSLVAVCDVCVGERLWLGSTGGLKIAALLPSRPERSWQIQHKTINTNHVSITNGSHSGILKKYGQQRSPKEPMCILWLKININNNSSYSTPFSDMSWRHCIVPTTSEKTPLHLFEQREHKYSILP